MLPEERRDTSRTIDPKDAAIYGPDLTFCPSCDSIVPAEWIERCRCRHWVCPVCGTIEHLFGVEDELCCDTVRCRIESLEAGLRSLDHDLTLATREYHQAMDAASERIDAICRR